MPSPKKSGTTPVKPMETDIEEKMECEGSPVEDSDMNIASPAPSEQPESEDASSSEKTGESIPSVVVLLSTGSSAATEGSTAQAVSPTATEGSTAQAMSPTATEGSTTPMSPEGCSPRSFLDCIKGTGRKPSPNKGGAGGLSPEGSVVSPKSKGKSRTPKKGEKSSKQSVSPNQGATLSPEMAEESEEGKAAGSRKVSPMKSGKPGFFRRLLSPGKDKQGDQKAARGPDYHEDSGQGEDVPLTAIASPKGSGKVKKSLLELLGLKSESKREIPPELRGDLVAKVSEKVNPEDASDCTVSTSLSPSSTASDRKGDGTESMYFETNFPVPQLPQDEPKTSSGQTPESTPEVTEGDSSTEAVSGALPEEEAKEEASESGKPPEETPLDKSATD